MSRKDKLMAKMESMIASPEYLESIKDAFIKTKRELLKNAELTASKLSVMAIKSVGVTFNSKDSNDLVFSIIEGVIATLCADFILSACHAKEDLLEDDIKIADEFLNRIRKNIIRAQKGTIN